MRQLAVWGAPLALLCLTGCQHVRPDPVVENCSIPARRMIVGDSHLMAATAGEAQAEPSFEADVLQALKRRHAAPAPPPPGIGFAPAEAPPAAAGGTRPEFLILSGGGQHGAFGGGLFVGLYRLEHPQPGDPAPPASRPDSPPHVPTYDIVTGISTGSLLSTMLFLANDPLPDDRTYPSDQGEGVFKPHRSSVEDMGVALSISSEKALLTHGRSAVLDALNKGAAGDLGPLRQRLLGFISADTLRLIKQAAGTPAAPGRKLYVGVTNVDDGVGYALDLTELSKRIPDKVPGDTAAQDNAKALSLRKCYVDTLIASSSVPIGAQPITLDYTTDGGLTVERALFVDGGARFGVFLGQVAPAVSAAKDIGPVNVTLVVNGVLYAKPWIETPGRPDPKTDKWNAVSVGLRTVKLMENQVYRFSVDSVESFPVKGGDLRMAFISDERLEHLQGDPIQHVFQARTCEAWRREDKAREKPFEFDARYMACLFDYGQTRAREDPWNLYVKGDGAK